MRAYPPQLGKRGGRITSQHRATAPGPAAPHPGPATTLRPDAPADSPGDEERRFPETWPTGRLMSAVTRRVERTWDAHLAHWDLNHASLPVLAHLAAGPRSQRELATACEVTEQTMSKTVGRLERSGYIERPTRAADRRQHDVVLTPSGFAALCAAGEARAAEEMVLRGLDGEQVEQLRGLLLLMWAAEGSLEASGEAGGEANG